MVLKLLLRDPKKIVPLCLAALFFLTIFINNSPCMTKLIFYPVYREIKKECFVLGVGDFLLEETENFKIYYHDVNYSYVDIVKDSAEKSLKLILEDFKYEPCGKINVVIYPEYREMASKIGLASGSTAMGVYFGGTISILDPSKWIKNNDNMAGVFQKDGPMVHELTHYIVDYMTGGNIPVWFTEGIALYEEYRVNGVEWLPNKKYQKYYEIEELDKDFYGLDEIKAYRQSFIMVKFIGDNFGIRCLISIVKELGMGKTIDRAAKKVLNMDVEEIFKKSLLIN